MIFQRLCLLGILACLSLPASVPVSLRDAANRGFRDDLAGDRQGGWTDQGPDNDLALFPTGSLQTAGITFDIVDPSTNAGRSALVLSATQRGGALPLASLPVPAHHAWKNIHVLHAGAWLPADGKPVGRIRMRYTDGSESAHEVVAGRDVGNWWTPRPLPNGVVGWTGENASSAAGLYVSRFVVEEKPVASITLEGVGGALWMIAGLSGSAGDLMPLRPEIPLVMKADAEWAPYAHSIEIEPGGVFDFSQHTDAPAGKHGPLIATPDGRFEFAGRPGVRVRMWGVNLCFEANYLDRAVADRLAVRLAASGYNAVRFHHFDRDLVAKSGPTHVFDPEQLDKLDYLFAAMKRRGLYINTDLFTTRPFSAEEMTAMGMNPAEDSKAQFKALIPVSDAVFEIWTRFAKNLLTRRNPHTGLTWAEDPALVGICPVNEDPLSITIERSTVARRLYREKFSAWWQLPENRQKAGDDRTTGFNLFQGELQRASDRRMHAYLRSLGVRAPLTGANCVNSQGLAFAREAYDYVDNHEYWDHPTFPETQWLLPFGFSQGSATGFTARVPRGLMPVRVWGKPYVVSEFNFVRPNQYRAEGGVLMPAYASLQDWDALYNFEYAWKRDDVVTGGTEGTFSLADDPIGLLADRVSALLFLRGDIAPARHALGYAVQSPEAFGGEQGAEFPQSFARLGLVTRIGSGTGTPAEELVQHRLDAVVGQASVPHEQPSAKLYRADAGLPRRLQTAGIIPSGSVDETGTRFVSDTGQIELDVNNRTLKVAAPRCELFVLPAGHAAGGPRVSVKNGETFSTVSVVSLDEKPLGESSRLLVLHLTNALATGMTFVDQDRRIMTKRGGLPHLVRAGTAELRMKLSTDKKWRAWSVDATGKRQHELPLTREGDDWLLHAQTVTPEGTRLAYELAAD